MKERPILFSTPMMLANMAGIKSVTRRTSGLDEINDDPDGWFFNGATIDGTELYAGFSNKLNGKAVRIRCPYGMKGDLLWARETFKAELIPETCYTITYKSDGQHGVMGKRVGIEYNGKWKPSIHMPRWACRFEAQNKGVRIDRLNNLTNTDALSEGIHRFEKMPGMWHAGEEFPKSSTPLGAFVALWESINGSGSWKHNPWVWVISYDNPRSKL